MNQENEPPAAPEELPRYVVEAVERQPADRLRALAEWAARLASHKATTPDVDADRQEELRERVEAAGHSADPSDYDVPDRAYITVKTPREGYEYAYWQWRSVPDEEAPDSNESIGPLD